jgi:LSD1 subclass zinc finger protein
MNVDLASGHDDMKRGYEFVCGGCGRKTLVKMAPGTPVTIKCYACQTVLYSKEGSRVYVGDREVPGNRSIAVEMETDIREADGPALVKNGRRKDKKPAVTTPPAAEKVNISDEENARARRMLDWLS